MYFKFLIESPTIYYNEKSLVNLMYSEVYVLSEFRITNSFSTISFYEMNSSQLHGNSIYWSLNVLYLTY